MPSIKHILVMSVLVIAILFLINKVPAIKAVVNP